MALTLGTTGMDSATEAELRAAFLQANATQGGRWHQAVRFGLNGEGVPLLKRLDVLAQQRRLSGMGVRPCAERQ